MQERVISTQTLPKGFQITQDTTPICRGGFVTIYSNEGEEKKIPLIRMHLEEDTGKSLTWYGGGYYHIGL